jgi:hypothetical protein
MPGEDHRDNRPRHFDARALQLRSDDTGAHWSVALDRTQLTYFEVGPHCRFEPHSHRSEQITASAASTLPAAANSLGFSEKRLLGAWLPRNNR